MAQTKEQRTLKQNDALHRWAELIAAAYNEKGLTIPAVLKNFKMELYWTKDSVKEIIIKTAIKRMYNKDSTTQLLKNDKEIDDLVDVVTLFNSKMEIEYIPWPSIEGLEQK